MLLFIAAIVWTIAGSMLLFKGMKMLQINDKHLYFIISGSAIAGSLFYLMVFTKISLKHTRRIVNLKNDNPCIFSFFNIKSYILMSIMITSGITIRVFGVVPLTYLSIVYLTMGVPLFFSAFRFYYYGIFYRSALNLKVN